MRRNYCFFSVESALLPVAGAVGELPLLELEPPLAALPLGDDGELDEPELLAPPDAGELGEALDEDELELLSVDDEPSEPEAEPDGEAGEVGEEVEPADEEVEPGARAPVLFVASRSQAVSRLAPSARDTAAARVESLMWPPWLGYHRSQQGSGQPPGNQAPA